MLQTRDSLALVKLGETLCFVPKSLGLCLVSRSMLGVQVMFLCVWRWASYAVLP